MKLLVLLAALLPAACSSRGVPSTPAGPHDASGAAVFAEFSIQPPPGNGWMESRPAEAPPASDGTQYRVAFVKDTLPENVLALVMTRPIPASRRAALSTRDGRMDYLRELVTAQRRSERALAERGRLRLVSSNFQLDPWLGYDCYRHDSVTEQGSGSPRDADIVATHSHVIGCLDPANRLVAELGYIQRVGSGAVASDATAEGEGFLRGFRFTAPAAPPALAKP